RTTVDIAISPGVTATLSGSVSCSYVFERGASGPMCSSLARLLVAGRCCRPARSPSAQGRHMASGQFYETLGGRRHSAAGPGDEGEALLIPRIQRHPGDAVCALVVADGEIGNERIADALGGEF